MTMTTNILRYRAALEAKKEELSQTLRSRAPIAIENTAETCEQVVLAAERELAVVALDRNSRLMREVQAALVRIEDGTYGVCESCGEAIRPARLDAVPWARFCVHCQERFDGGPGPGRRYLQENRLAA